MRLDVLNAGQCPNEGLSGSCVAPRFVQSKAVAIGLDFSPDFQYLWALCVSDGFSGGTVYASGCLCGVTYTVPRGFARFGSGQFS